MTDIGIFLGYGRGIPLRDEGLGRLLAFLVGGIAELPAHRLTIACPSWLVQELRALLDEHGVRPGAYALLGAVRRPSGKLRHRLASKAWSGHAWVCSRAQRARPLSWRETSTTHESTTSLAPVRRMLVSELRTAKSMRSWPRAAVCMARILPLLALGAGIEVASRPPLLSLEATVRLRRLWRTWRAHGSLEAARSVRRHFRRPRLAPPGASVADEVPLLIEEINRQQAVRHWLVPTPFWPEIDGIRHSRTLVFPDLVLQEFPLRFCSPDTEVTYARILGTVQRAERVICYSQHTKVRQLIQGVGLASEQIEVIGHARVDLREQLSPGGGADLGQIRETATTVLRENLPTGPGTAPYVFFASHDRGQKNIISLLRAVRILRFRGSEPVRLILTCARRPGSTVDRFVSEHDMEPLVLFFPRVPNRVLAALYACASTAVNPTLFEGGFPFTFTEAFSVGTPSLMSDIPMVRERVTDQALRARMLFDPFDPQDLSLKLQWGLANRDRLLEMQRPLYEGFPRWVDVARRYCEAVTRESPPGCG